MTKARSLLSVRLDPALAEALARHCAQAGVSRSQAVKQGLAEYLVTRSGPTLATLAEEVLPPPAASPPGARKSRQQRFRDYVREKRRR